MVAVTELSNQQTTYEYDSSDRLYKVLSGVQVRTLMSARGYMSTSEPIVHFGLPLQTQARRADDQHGPRAVTQQQFLDDEACLNRLAEPHVVG